MIFTRVQQSIRTTCVLDVNLLELITVDSIKFLFILFFFITADRFFNTRRRFFTLGLFVTTSLSRELFSLGRVINPGVC